MIAAPFVGFCRDLNVRLTPAQRVLALVAFDRADPTDLDDEDREIARELFGELVDEVPREARRVAAFVVGARSGKSYVLCGLRALHLALTVPLDTLAPGELASAIIVAPDMRLARITLRFAIGAIEKTSTIRRCVVRTTDDSVTLARPDGKQVTIEALPAARGGSATRGRSLVCGVLDEAALFRDDASVVNDVDVFRAIVPRVLPGGQTIVASTPYAEEGLLWDLHASNFGNPTTSLVAHARSELMRPGVWMRTIVAFERARDPENARREFDACFLSSGGTHAYDREDVRAAVDVGIDRRPPMRDAYYSAGLDLSGGRNDHHALVIVHGERYDEGGPLHVVVDHVFRSRGALEGVLGEIAAVLADYGINEARRDAYGADLARALLEKSGVRSVESSMSSERQHVRFGRLGELLRTRRIRLVDSPVLVDELCELRAIPRAGGRMVYEAPRGKHDDVADALALAVDGVEDAMADTLEIPPPTILRFDEQPMGAMTFGEGSFEFDRGPDMSKPFWRREQPASAAEANISSGSLPRWLFK